LKSLRSGMSTEIRAVAAPALHFGRGEHLGTAAELVRAMPAGARRGDVYTQAPLNRRDALITALHQRNRFRLSP